jgi:long-chain acyl-CoA synthetase
MEVAAPRPKFLQAIFAQAIRAGGGGVLRPLFDRLFFRAVRNGFGGSIRFVITGGAPLPPKVAHFFAAVGVPVLEGYGLTETSPVVTVNRLERNRIGTVGPAIPGVEVRIAADGEVLVRGPNVMKGYFRNSVATAEVIDPAGWFRTGDIGEIDRDGFLRITDRKKDLLVTSGGKKVAPQPIENDLRADAIVAHACLVGEGRNYICALIVPNFDGVESKTRLKGLRFLTREELVADPTVRGWFAELVERVNASRASYERIKRFCLVPKEWTVADGELTPTQKVRRREIVRRYASTIEELYKPSEERHNTEGR